MNTFCAVIPAYNEEGRIAAVITSASRYVQTVIVVDDGSCDSTAEASGRAGALVTRHPTNMGKGGALKTGLAQAVAKGFTAAITLDADGQHNPEEIPRFIEEFERSGADIIVGSRMKARSGMPFVRWATNAVTSAVVSWISGRKIADSQSGFRLIKCATAARLSISSSRYDAESEILVKAARKGLTIGEVPVSTIYGDEKSKINPLADTCRFVRLAVRLIFNRD